MIYLPASYKKGTKIIMKRYDIIAKARNGGRFPVH